MAEAHVNGVRLYYEEHGLQRLREARGQSPHDVVADLLRGADRTSA